VRGIMVSSKLSLLLPIFFAALVTVATSQTEESRVSNVYHLHLTLSNYAGAMTVAWVSYGKTKMDQYALYGRYRGELKYTAVPEVSQSLVEEANPLGTAWTYRAEMGGLSPFTTVYYKIVSKSNNGSTHETQVYQFKSKPESNSIDRVQFAGFGDVGVTEGALMTAKRLEQLALSKPSELDFVVHLGDLAYSFEHWHKWNTWFHRTEPIASSTPYMIATGNHDWDHIVKDRILMPRPFHSGYNHAECLTKNNMFYDFDYGLIGVVVLPYRKPYTGCPQLLEWFEQTLERYHHRIQDDRDPIRWLCVAMHTPFYTSSNGHVDKTTGIAGNKALKDMIEHLFVKYQVDIAIFGDDHNYERTYPVFDDTPDTDVTRVKDKEGRNVSVYNSPKKPMHFLIGTGGTDLDGWQHPTPPAWSAYREINHGFVHFDVTPTTLSGRFVRSKDGSEQDHFQIIKNRDGRSDPRQYTRDDTRNGLKISRDLVFWIIAVVSGTAVFCYKKRGSFIGFESKGK